jgi:cellulose synthase (UDP-forming)
MKNEYYNFNEDKAAFLHARMPKLLLVANALMAVVYFIVLAFFFPHHSYILFSLLIAGEIFHVWQVFTYIWTIWSPGPRRFQNPHFTPPVDVFITVAGEPVDIVKETLSAALNMRYPNFTVYILNDGYVAKKDNWREIEELAESLGARCITRRNPGGAKAGNINNGLASTKNPFFVVFDADHVPHQDFLLRMMPYFADPAVGFVQAPQYYKNHSLNTITQSSWEQQQLFFGPICRGKDRLGMVTMAGTNMAIRREAIDEVGGICTDSIAEDFATGMFMHENGWKSVYVPEVLAEGLAPEDFGSYYKQQHRWARGALDVLFHYKLLFREKLTFTQKMQYLSSVSFFFSGIVVLLNAVMPLVFFFTGRVPLEVSTATLAAVFLPYIFLTIYTLQRSSNFTFTFGALAFSIGSFGIHISALISALLGRKATFAITSKKRVSGNFLHLVIPHIAYGVIVCIGITVAISREGFSPSVINNIAWAIFNVAVFIPFIYAACEGWLTEVAPKRARSTVERIPVAVHVE